MPNQEESPDGRPRVDPTRPSADVGRDATDGQSNRRGTGATDQQGDAPPQAQERPWRQQQRAAEPQRTRQQQQQQQPRAAAAQEQQHQHQHQQGQQQGAQGQQAGQPNDAAARPQADAGDGPGRIGLTSDRQPDLVAPSGVNQRDHGAADDKPMGGGSVDFDDDDQAHPRGNTGRTGGTWDAQGGDSGRVGKAPGAGLSDRNGPSAGGDGGDRGI